MITYLLTELPVDRGGGVGWLIHPTKRRVIYLAWWLGVEYDVLVSAEMYAVWCERLWIGCSDRWVRCVLQVLVILDSVRFLPSREYSRCWLVTAGVLDGWVTARLDLSGVHVNTLFFFCRFGRPLYLYWINALNSTIGIGEN